MEVDLVVVGAVEDAVELTVFEGEVELRDEGLFFFAGLAREFEVFAFDVFVAVIFFELV